ncbi:hypothetical protein D3C78_1284780 [compost metagenome]
MTFAIGQFAPDTDEEYRAQLFCDRTFTAFCIKIRETTQQILTVNKVDRVWQERCQTEFFTDGSFSRFNSRINRFYGRFQRTDMALAIAHHTLPVPLVNIDRMNGCQAVFIGAQGFHVRVKPFARAEVVLS